MNVYSFPEMVENTSLLTSELCSDFFEGVGLVKNGEKHTFRQEKYDYLTCGRMGSKRTQNLFL